MRPGDDSRVALITGATGGIGTALAHALATLGFSIALSGRRKDALERLSGSLTSFTSVSQHVCDLTSHDMPEALIQDVLRQYGRLDLLINNAGMGGGGSVDRATPSDWEQAITVNLVAAMKLAHAAVPALRTTGSGCIINISSIAAQSSYAGGEAYAASKAGLSTFGRCLFESIRESGIKVCSLSPGFVNTEMVGGAGLDRSRMIQPNDIADAVRYVLSASRTCCPTEIVLRPQRSPYTKD